jgi:hypothetical protein
MMKAQLPIAVPEPTEAVTRAAIVVPLDGSALADWRSGRPRR